MTTRTTDDKPSAVPPASGATPYLTVKGAADAIGWYQRVFGARLDMRLNAPDGTVMHAELTVGPASFMLSEEMPAYQSLGPTTIGGSATTVILYVPDVDTVVARAQEAGARLTMPVADQFWGDRAGSLTDPFGHRWMIATHIEDPSPDEIERRMNSMFRQEQGKG